MIGIVGAYGAVGSAAASELARIDGVSLRLGGRDRQRLGALASHLDKTAASISVSDLDLTDAAALAAFCADCSVVVNTAGPAYRVLDTVARAASGAGAAYVDAAGDDDLAMRVGVLYPSEGTLRAILSAGMLPGLSGLLPRYVAGGLDAADRLHAYLGGRSALTPAAAADFLLSEGAREGQPLAGWSGGSHPLRPLRDVELPFFPGRVTATPHLTSETERTARALGLAEAHWFNVFVGEQATALLARRSGNALDANFGMAQVSDFSRAVGLDLLGHETYQTFACQVEGAYMDHRQVRTLVLRVADGYQLTGSTAAFAALQTAAGNAPLGTAHLPEAVDASAAVEWLQDSPLVASVAMFDDLPLVEDILRGENEAADVLFEAGEL